MLLYNNGKCSKCSNNYINISFSFQSYIYDSLPIYGIHDYFLVCEECDTIYHVRGNSWGPDKLNLIEEVKYSDFLDKMKKAGITKKDNAWQ